jgi:hypothetical protein
VFLLDEVQQLWLHARCLKKFTFKLFMSFIFGDAGLICVWYLTLSLIVPSRENKGDVVVVVVVEMCNQALC